MRASWESERRRRSRGIASLRSRRRAGRICRDISFWKNEPMVRSSDRPRILPAGRRSRHMTTNTKGEIAQSDRARLRTLAQKRRAAKAERREIMLELRRCGLYERELMARKLGVRVADRAARSRPSARRAPARRARSLRPSASDAADEGRCGWSMTPSKLCDLESGRAPGQDRRLARPLSRAGGRRARRTGRAVEPLSRLSRARRAARADPCGAGAGGVAPSRDAESCRADRRSFEPRRFGRRDRGARG